MSDLIEIKDGVGENCYNKNAIKRINEISQEKSLPFSWVFTIVFISKSRGHRFKPSFWRKIIWRKTINSNRTIFQFKTKKEAEEARQKIIGDSQDIPKLNPGELPLPHTHPYNIPPHKLYLLSQYSETSNGYIDIGIMATKEIAESRANNIIKEKGVTQFVIEEMILNKIDAIDADARDHYYPEASKGDGRGIFEED